MSPLMSSATDIQSLCLRTIACETAERAPKYIPAIACDVASELLGRPAHTGSGSLHYAEALALSHGPQAHAEFVAQLAQDVEAIHRLLGIDVFREPVRFCPLHSVRQVEPFTFIVGDVDADHTVWRYEPGSADFSHIQRIERRPREPEERLADTVAAMEAQCEQWEEDACSYAQHLAALGRRLGDSVFVVANGGLIYVGLEADDMMALAMEPGLMARKLMLQAEQAIILGRALGEAGCNKVMLGGGDMAGNKGPMYSPDAFRDVVLPAYRYAMAALRPMGMHLVFRSDGDLGPVADMLFVEANCPGYGETDRDAGMTMSAMRRRYPQLVVWGNVSSRFLTQASPAEVRDQSRRILEESEGRGYFHGCSNAIIKGTPAANVEALFSV